MEWKTHTVYTLTYHIMIANDIILSDCVKGSSGALLMSSLLLGASWRYGAGRFTGISWANGKRLSSPKDGIRKMMKGEWHCYWQDLFCLEKGAEWWYGIEGLSWPQRTNGCFGNIKIETVGTPQCLKIKLEYWNNMNKNILISCVTHM